MAYGGTALSRSSEGSGAVNPLGDEPQALHQLQHRHGGLDVVIDDKDVRPFARGRGLFQRGF
jgi:hypothetical protein